MKTKLDHLIEDAALALDTIKKSNSMVMKKGAAEWLKSIAAEIETELRKP